MTNIILWGCLLITLAAMYFTQRNETKFKKNIVMGATLPFEARQDSKVNQLIEAYKKNLRWFFWIMLVVCIGGIFLQSETVSLISWSVALLAILVVPNALYIRTNQKLKQRKREQGWAECFITIPMTAM